MEKTQKDQKKTKQEVMQEIVSLAYRNGYQIVTVFRQSNALGRDVIMSDIDLKQITTNGKESN